LCYCWRKLAQTPEWGYVTAITSNTTLTIGLGFSSGGSAYGRTYNVIDKSATSGAHLVKINYLDGGFNEKVEVVILNGTTAVATINTDIYRINAFRVVAAGSSMFLLVLYQ